MPPKQGGRSLNYAFIDPKSKCSLSESQLLLGPKQLGKFPQHSNSSQRGPPSHSALESIAPHVLSQLFEELGMQAQIWVECTL